MSDVKWIKIVTDIFDDEKMLLIESLPGADSLIVIWFKMLCLAGKINNNGVFLMNDRIAYTDEMLATIFRRDVNTVRLALRTFQEYGMIEIIEGVITIPNWGKHQSLDKLEKKKEYMREYMSEYRDKQKGKIDCKTNCKTNSKTNSKTNVNPLEEDIEEDIDIEKDINISSTKVDDCASLQESPTYVYQDIVDLWNSLEPLGIKKCMRIPNGSPRIPLLKKRLKEYGRESFNQIIEEIKHSDFLQGKISSKGKEPFDIDFGWVIRPKNYPKILEGKYRNKDYHPEKVDTPKEPDRYDDYE